MMNSIKEMVKDKTVKFSFYRDKELWYVTECGFEFPVPVEDTGKGVFPAEDKALYFMRWIRKHHDVINDAVKEKSDFQQKHDREMAQL